MQQSKRYLNLYYNEIINLSFIQNNLLSFSFSCIPFAGLRSLHSTCDVLFDSFGGVILAALGDAFKSLWATLLGTFRSLLNGCLLQCLSRV